jgi:hypothetical protein
LHVFNPAPTRGGHQGGLALFVFSLNLGIAEFCSLIKRGCTVLIPRFDIRAVLREQFDSPGIINVGKQRRVGILFP